MAASLNCFPIADFEAKGGDMMQRQCSKERGEGAETATALGA